MQHLRICLQQLVGCLGDLLLILQNFFLPFQSDSQNDLIFPQRDRLQDGCLYLIYQKTVIVLDQADLRSRLHGDRLRDLHIMDLFLKAIYVLLVIFDYLRAHGVAFCFRFFTQPWQCIGPDIGYLFFSGLDIDLQIAEMVDIHIIHGIEHGNIPYHTHTVFFQFIADPVYLHFDRLIALRELVQGVQ